MEMINMIHDFKVNVSFLSTLAGGLNFSYIPSIILDVADHLNEIQNYNDHDSKVLQLRYKSRSGSNVSDSRYFGINSYVLERFGFFPQGK